MYLGKTSRLVLVYSEQMSIFVTLLHVNVMPNPPTINYNPPISGADDFWKVS